MNLALWNGSRIMSCISLLHSLQFSRLLRLEETIHLRGCFLQIRVIQDVASRFHAGGLVPGDLHPHTLVDPGEAHVAYCRSAEVVKEKGRDASGFAGFTPSTQLRAHGSGVVEEYPLATLRASFVLPPEPVLHLSVERQFAPFCLWSGTPATECPPGNRRGVVRTTTGVGILGGAVRNPDVAHLRVSGREARGHAR